MDQEAEAGFAIGLAEWLRERMAERRLGQRQLAKFAQVSVGTISAILHGRVTPRFDVIAALATYFGEEPAEVLAAASLAGLAAAPLEARAEATHLLRRLYALEPQDRAHILHQLNEILDFLERAPSAAGDAATPVGQGRQSRRPRRAAGSRRARAS